MYILDKLLDFQSLCDTRDRGKGIKFHLTWYQAEHERTLRLSKIMGIFIRSYLEYRRRLPNYFLFFKHIQGKHVSKSDIIGIFSSARDLCNFSQLVQYLVTCRLGELKTISIVLCDRQIVTTWWSNKRGLFLYRAESTKQLKEIEDSQWINECTREIAFNFAVYTPFLRAIR